jgi:hypothetical protein
MWCSAVVNDEVEELKVIINWMSAPQVRDGNRGGGDVCLCMWVGWS